MDPTGFLDLLNSARAQNSLDPLVWDQELADYAAKNNAVQRTEGLGHFVSANTWQCSFVNISTAENALSGFLADRRHRVILLRSDLTRCGVAFDDGNLWTVNLL